MTKESLSKNECLRFVLEQSKSCAKASGIYNLFADVACRYEQSQGAMLVFWRGEPTEDHFMMGREVNAKLKKHWPSLAREFSNHDFSFCSCDRIKNTDSFSCALGFSLGNIEGEAVQGLLVLSEPVDDDYLGFIEILLNICHNKIQEFDEKQDANLTETDETFTENLYLKMLNASRVLIGVHNFEGRFVAVTDAFCEKTGYSREKLLSSYLWDVETDYTLEGYKSTWEEAKKGPLTFTGRHLGANGVSFPMEVNINLCKSGNEEFIVGVMTDISERNKYEQEIKKLTLAIEQSPVLVVITDTEQVIEYANEKTLDQMGYSKNSLIGESIAILRSPKVDKQVIADLDNALAIGEEWRGELLAITIEEESFWVSAKVTPLLDDVDEIAHYLYVMEDISDRKKFQETLEHQASYDSLTKLPNRFYGMQQFEEAIKKALNAGDKLGVFFLDLDTFKETNDNLGHEAGDKLLTTIAERLSKACRKQDTVIRLGGDEFMIIVEHGQTMEDFEKIAEKLLELSRLPVEYETHELKTSASIGLAILPEHGKDRKTLMRHADLAMYYSKSQGKDQWFVYSEAVMQVGINTGDD